MEAKVIMAKCEKYKDAFGIRIQKEQTAWLITWAFEIDEKIASKEGFGSASSMKASLVFSGDYPGCPHCGANSMFTCGKCGQVSCWDGNEMTTCAWCGNKTKVKIVDELNIKSGGF